VFCQLEILRDCLPSSVRRFLDELPESLDETYDRILREIKKPNRDHARRLLQCLILAIRPLQVKELAEVLAIDFNDAEEIPKLNPSWRWEDQERALLTSCSSLIAIVGTGRSRVVQFSHFSVKEYLTSARLATSSQDVSRYHIAVEPAHTILAQACVSVLLQLGDHDEQDSVENAPLAGYAAEHWVRHAQVEDVVTRIKGTEYLFDLDKPYFAAWRQLHDIYSGGGSSCSTFCKFIDFSKSRFNSTPLYYASLCGFQGLVERLILKYPWHLDAIGGYYMTPFVAALAGRHFQVAQVLHRNGASVDLQGIMENTPLHSTVHYGDLEMIQGLLECKADLNARNIYGDTPLLFALALGSLEDPEVAQFLLVHGADPNACTNERSTPLHFASEYGNVEIARVLIEHGADVEVKDVEGKTPLVLASEGGHEDIIELLRASLYCTI
jgi:hypothetical protein